MKTFVSSKISQSAELDFVNSLASSKWKYSLRMQFVTYRRLQYVIDGAQVEPTSNQQIFSRGWLWQVKPKGKPRFPLKTGTTVPRFIELSKSLHGNSQRFQFWTVAKLWSKAVTNIWIFWATQQHRHDMQLLDTHLYASNVALQPLCNLPFCRSQRNQWLSSNASPQ